MSNLNKAMLIGRIGRDPETRVTQNGSAVTTFSMATNDYWKDKQGNRQEKTDWHNIVTWGYLADFSANYLKKGRLVYVEGRLQTRDWTDQQNVKHYKTEIVANSIQLLDRQQGEQRTEGGEGSRPGGGGYSDYSPAGQQNDQEQGQGQGETQKSPGEEPYLEDDIPF